MQKGNGFGARGYRRKTSFLDYFSHSGSAEVTPLSKHITATYGFQVFGSKRIEPIKFRTVRIVCHHPAIIRMHPGGDGGSIHLGRSNVGCMMIPKKRTPLRQF